jgi:hypothetical protein
MKLIQDVDTLIEDTDKTEEAALNQSFLWHRELFKRLSKINRIYL